MLRDEAAGTANALPVVDPQVHALPVGSGRLPRAIGGRGSIADAPIGNRRKAPVPKPTRPERALETALTNLGIPHVRHAARLPGKPDFILTDLRVAIFVHGCFWHGCPRHGKQPRSTGEYWREKLRGNIERDFRVIGELRKMGWRVAIMWEHELCGPGYQSNDAAVATRAFCRLYRKITAHDSRNGEP